MTHPKVRSKASKLMRYMKAPLKFLMKTRDMYVQGMMECSGRFAYVDAAMGCPTGQFCSLPRSFSVNSSRSSASNEDDFKELVRAASLRSHRNTFDLGSVTMKMPKSRSVGRMGRIDEDKPCDFEVDIKPRVYPRSASYAIR